MDQAKEYLRLAIKYRFWIAVGLSLLLPLIGYLAAAGSIRSDADSKKSAIEGADKDVQKYSSPGIPNAQYEPLVKGRHVVLDKDVAEAWRFLFNRQASILAWPKSVEDRFPVWGRKWPDLDAAAVQQASYDYIMAYNDQVDMIYKIFNPFDPETGEGVVVAPPKEVLLSPAVFDRDHPPTDISKIWNAQEKLWVQRAMLEIVAKENQGKTKWEDAPIRQLNSLVVANSSAQDQRSAIKAEAIIERPAITQPGVAPAAAAASGSAGTNAQGAASAQNAQAQMGNMMTSMGKRGGVMGGGGGGMGAMGAMGGGGEGPVDDGSVKFIKSNNKRFDIVPVYISVMIEQEKVHEFLIALEQSPMAIQINEFQEAVPDQPITKPEKGKQFGGMAGGGGPGNMMDMMRNGRGGNEMMEKMMKNQGGMGGGPNRAGAAGKSSGTAKRDPKQERLDREKKAKEAEKAEPQLVFDPYYDIVQLEVYGQARLFSRPPAEAKPATSAGAAPSSPPAAATAPAAGVAKAPTPPQAPPATTQPAPAAKADAGKADAPKADAGKADAPKADAGKAASAPSGKSDPAKDAPKSANPTAPKEPSTPPAASKNADSAKSAPAPNAGAPAAKADSGGAAANAAPKSDAAPPGGESKSKSDAPKR